MLVLVVVEDLIPLGADEAGDGLIIGIEPSAQYLIQHIRTKGRDGGGWWGRWGRGGEGDEGDEVVRRRGRGVRHDQWFLHWWWWWRNKNTWWKWFNNVTIVNQFFIIACHSPAFASCHCHWIDRTLTNAISLRILPTFTSTSRAPSSLHFKRKWINKKTVIPSYLKPRWMNKSSA